MKKLLLLSALLIFACSSDDSSNDDNNGDNSSLLVSKMIEESLDQQDYSEYNYSYNGNKLSQIIINRYSSSEGAFAEPTERYKFEYYYTSDKISLVQEHGYSETTSSYYLTAYFELEYDSQGRFILESSYLSDGTLYELSSINWNSDGSCDAIVEVVQNTSDFEVESTSAYNFNNNGDISNWQVNYDIYDEDNCIPITRSLQYDNNNGAFKNIIGCEGFAKYLIYISNDYVPANNNILSWSQNSQCDGLVGGTSWSYDYNGNGYPLTSIYSINNEPETIITFEYYD